MPAWQQCQALVALRNLCVRDDENKVLLANAGAIDVVVQAMQNHRDDPQIQAREMRIDLPHPLAGSAPGVANPIRLSESPVEYRSAPPTLGQHTEAVLQSLLAEVTENLDTQQKQCSGFKQKVDQQRTKAKSLLEQYLQTLAK